MIVYISMSFEVSGGAMVTFFTMTAHLLDSYAPVSVSELHTFVRSLEMTWILIISFNHQ